MKKSNPKALMPIGVFLVLYLGLGIVFEYVMKIPMGFYNIPIVLAFMVEILVACFQNREVSFDDKLSIMAQGLADKNIIDLPCGGELCWSCGKKQCGERGIFHAFTDSGQVFRGGVICSCVCCINRYGNFSRNNYIDCPDRSGSF